jgi:preprotein translocase subunit YajC
MDTTLFVMTFLTGFFLGIIVLASVFAYLIYRDDKKRSTRRADHTQEVIPGVRTSYDDSIHDH